MAEGEPCSHWHYVVAIAYVMQKTPFVFPIIGGRKVEQLDDNIEALSIALSEEQVKYLEGILPFQPGFPHSIVVSVAYIKRTSTGTHRIAPCQGDGSEYIVLAKTAGNFDKWPRPQAIRPSS